jgi:hypothetical protein
MNLWRCGAMGLGLALVLVSGPQVMAQNRIQIQRPAIGAASGPLVPAELQDKLKLTDEQKKKLADLEKEFQGKSKEANDKLTQIRAKIRDRTPVEAVQQLREQMQAVRQLRADYEGKVKALLDDDQKKKYEAEARPARPAIQIQPALPLRRPAPNAPGQLLPADVLEKLNLTAEQKEKLEKLLKEYENKALDVLTDEQKKKYEDLKKETPQPTPLRRRDGN